MRTALGLLACILAAPSALADPVAYEIDPGHTHVLFAVERFGFADTIGIFPDSEGVIRLDRGDPAASSVSARVRTASVWTGLDARDNAVRGSSWLDIATHDEISFESVRVDLLDDISARVTGNFTLLGVTREETFDVTLNRIGPDVSRGGQEGAGFSITGEISRSDYGLDTAMNLVGDRVAIRIEMLAHRVDAQD